MFATRAPLAPPTAPLGMPVLSPGRHRTPRKGACFMEMASYLAGERWSDHPACTHPALAALARAVNDHSSDAGRGALAPLIPDVVGLRSDDASLDARLALLCATRALPVASQERAQVMAVAALAADRSLAPVDGRGPGALRSQTRAALDRTPHAAAWAQRFSARTGGDHRPYRRDGVPHVVGYAAVSIAAACVPDPDAMLRELLVDAIRVCRRVVPAAREAFLDPAPAAPATGQRSSSRASRV